MTGTDMPPPRPELSVIIATRDRAELLERCLGSLEQQTVPPSAFEVVVVDDGSTDHTAGLLDTLDPPYALTVLEQPRSGTSAARNAGAARATGQILLFVDDDEEADPRLVAAHVEAHREQQGIVACGAIARRVDESADRYAVLQRDEGNERIAELAARPLTYWDCCAGNLSLTRVAFDDVGGFAADLPRESDTELAYRLHRAGLELVFVPDAIVTEHRTKGWREILADVEARGRIAVELYRRHPPMIAAMPLGRRDELPRTRAGQAIVRVALALRVPTSLLGLAGLLAARRSWLRVWFFSILVSHAYWRGVRATADPELWRRLRSATVILCYHAFGADGEDPSRYVLPGRAFSRQLAWLRRRGYAVISLGEYLGYRTAHRLPPARTAVITIDDGYVDTATVAGPILRRFGCAATVFLISSLGGEQLERSDPALVGRPLIDRTSARNLLESPFEIGAHTRTHPNLTALVPADAATEIAGSKQELELALGVPVTTFAYPFGASDAVVRGLVEQAGFLGARGTREGWNHAGTDSYDLRRIEVAGTCSLRKFAFTLRLGELRG